MTLLEICQEVAGDLALAVPSTIVGNTDETATRLLAASQLAGESLARKPQGGWISMIREFDFSTSAVVNVAGTVANISGVAVISAADNSAFSSDFNSDFNSDFGGSNPVVPFTWYAFGTGIPANSIVTAVAGNVVTLNQAASAEGSGTFTFGKSDYSLPDDYQRPIDNTMWDRSRYWAMRGPQSPQQWQMYKSSVIGQASVQRRFRFRQIAGQLRFSIDPVPTDNAAALVFEYVSKAWCQSAEGAAQVKWLADTDTGILDEYLLTLGLRWRMLRRLGLSYNEELSEYESEVRKAMAHDGGAAILSIVPQSYSYLLSPSNVQEGSFPG